MNPEKERYLLSKTGISRTGAVALLPIQVVALGLLAAAALSDFLIAVVQEFWEWLS